MKRGAALVLLLGVTALAADHVLHIPGSGTTDRLVWKDPSGAEVVSIGSQVAVLDDSGVALEDQTSAPGGVAGHAIVAAVNDSGHQSLRVVLDGGTVTVLAGSGAPEGAVRAPIGAVYIRTTGGAATTLYLKESGADTLTGWAAVGAATQGWDDVLAVDPSSGANSPVVIAGQSVVFGTTTAAGARVRKGGSDSYVLWEKGDGSEGAVRHTTDGGGVGNSDLQLVPDGAMFISASGGFVQIKPDATCSNPVRHENTSGTSIAQVCTSNAVTLLNGGFLQAQNATSAPTHISGTSDAYAHNDIGHQSQRFVLDNGTVVLMAGTGSPESADKAPVGALMVRTDGGSGTTLYTKGAGTDVTGWDPVLVGGAGIDTTTGDAATINRPAGRFRKDTSGTTFTLTNSLISANSIVLLTFCTASATSTRMHVVAGSGSATITLDAAPLADLDVNFMVVN